MDCATPKRQQILSRSFQGGCEEKEYLPSPCASATCSAVIDVVLMAPQHASSGGVHWTGKAVSECGGRALGLGLGLGHGKRQASWGLYFTSACRISRRHVQCVCCLLFNFLTQSWAAGCVLNLRWSLISLAVKADNIVHSTWTSLEPSPSHSPKWPPVAACKFMSIKRHKKEAENVLCKKDDVENKINNKFCMQQHYETIANLQYLTLSVVLSHTPSFSPHRPCVGVQTAIGIFIACSTRRMRNTSKRLPDGRTSRDMRVFIASFDLCAIKCHKMKLNKRNVKLIFTYWLQFLSTNLTCLSDATRTSKKVAHFVFRNEPNMKIIQHINLKSILITKPDGHNIFYNFDTSKNNNVVYLLAFNKLLLHI